MQGGMMPAPIVRLAEFDDPYAMSQVQREAGVEWLSIGRHYRNSLTVLDFGNFIIQSAQVGAHVTRGITRPDRMTLLMAGGPIDATVNGWRPTEAGGMLLGPSAEFRTIMPNPLHWLGYSWDPGAFATGIDDGALPGHGSFAVEDDLVARTPALQRLAMDLAIVAQRDRTLLAAAAIAPAVRDNLQQALAGGMARADGGRRSLRQRMRVVALADAYLDQTGGRAVYTQDLVDALGIPARTLHSAYAAVYGMGPHQYLRLRRLNLARQALTAAKGEADLVKTIALDHGFWHLGRFARHYRDLFGESPSATQARSERTAWVGFRAER